LRALERLPDPLLRVLPDRDAVVDRLVVAPLRVPEEAGRERVAVRAAMAGRYRPSTTRHTGPSGDTPRVVFGRDRR
jgi:hypothetical protein